MASSNTGKGVGAALLAASLLLSKQCDTLVDVFTRQADNTSRYADDFWRKSSEPDVKPSQLNITPEVHLSETIAPNSDEVAEHETKRTDAIYLKKEVDGQYTVNKLAGRYRINDGRLYASLDEAVPKGESYVIVDGSLKKEEVILLNKKGINFICNKAIYKKEKDITKFKIIFIYSDNKEELKEIYSLNDEQVQEMIEISRPLTENVEVEKVANGTEFQRVILKMRLEGITPVVFLIIKTINYLTNRLILTKSLTY